MYSKGESEIQSFYENRSVFLTGVTGFLGKAILEKLLRSCPGIKTVYVLVRPKAGQTVESRLDAIFRSPLFDVLKETCPDVLEKVYPVSGDIEMPELGLSIEQRMEICRNVSVIIHSAASIKFNEPLKLAMNINYNGTKRVLQLAHNLHSLAALVYISTAYSNCDLREIPEEIIKPGKVLTNIDSMNDEAVADITPYVIENKPNTYTYTKALAESLLQEEGSHLPICVIRPSIIGATWKEPSAGFIDSLAGMTGVMAAVGKGLLTSMHCEKNRILDVIPLDVVVNLTVASAWSTYKNEAKKIPVFNCCSGPSNPATLANLRISILKSFEEVPCNGVLRYPNVTLTASYSFYMLIHTMLTLVPFALMDFVSCLLNKKPRMIKIYKKMESAMDALNFFIQNEWKFRMENIGLLGEEMCEKDKEMFYLNIEDMSWNEYISDYAVGIKKWIFKENLAHVPSAKKHMIKMYWIEKSVSILASLVVGYTACAAFL